jgi:mRNA-degrading endonuclease RelE of RelBE toxin-antitoxin system
VRCEFVFLPRFDRAVKQLKKQYRQVVDDLTIAFEHIEENPEAGAVIPRDYSVRKLRVSSRDMQRGKSGGFRLLYKLEDRPDEVVMVYILFVYAKSDQVDISLRELQALIRDMNQPTEGTE